jgi:uncharacterized repeat protein (TIGR01451 family)
MGHFIARLRRQKRRLAALLALMHLGAMPLAAANVAPTPGDRILIIYVNSSFGTAMLTNVQAALNAIPLAQRPTVDLLAIPVGDTNGFYDNLVGAGYSLTDYCQVWDMRFDDAGAGTSACGALRADTFWTGGANNDGQLLLNFMAQGGRVYVQGENEGYCHRNQGVTQFLNDAVTTGTVGYPSVAVGVKNWTTIDNTAPDNFASNYAALASVGTDYPGQVPLGQIAGGKALVRDGSFALAVLWDSAQLAPGNGRLMVGYDANLLRDGLTGYAAYVQNTYVTLSTCYNFVITKAVSPAVVCAGDPVTFTLCYQNTGTRAIPSAQVWDTLPACTTYSSATPAPSGNNGSVYYWNLGNLAPGPQQCISLVAQTQACP